MIQNIIDGVSVFETNRLAYKKLFFLTKTSVNWDRRIRSRKTASYGIPYNYSGMNYIKLDIPAFIKTVIDDIIPFIGYEPNNCLINFYESGNSVMGFHSDRTDILVPSTGITILSLGNCRTMRFKNKTTGESKDFIMRPNSFLHMSADVQDKWLHAILADPLEDNQRISITFRCLLE